MTQKEVIMATPYFPSLSTSGWISSGQDMADYVFSQFFLSDYSQTQLYLGQVSSMSWVLNRTAGSISDAMTLLQRTLNNYFGRYFDNVVVEVSQGPDSTTGSSATSLRIYASFTDSQGVNINLGRSIEIVNNKVKKVINLIEQKTI
jgi:hypothetical protein